ncbi:LPS-assembly protein LptD [Paraurantiacibacter namhicola]|uniref:LPS-assembly protein LptD n=1 Tax=Paraurantiacibacter namhicola TaxID=645517 RepID=A0A1C7DA63_9SPHN|nr:LPS assembly protein LptD [Paraurantiacibacter namhicola]ANU08389.1 LPS-assembly protein LptD precursor [Paraurantiacibacter namhicola]
MLPAPQSVLPTPASRFLSLRDRAVVSAWAMAAASLALPTLAAAQDGGEAPGIETAQEQVQDDPLSPEAAEIAGQDSAQDAPVQDPPPPEFNAAGERLIAFEANELAYDDNSDTVSATGDVLLQSGDQSVRADAVTWERASGVIVATGNVRFVDQDGNQIFTERLELTDELRAGAMENLLLAFREGGRLAAVEARRLDDGAIELDRAVYSGCAVEDSEGCPKRPSWRITAERVTYDPETKRITFSGAWFELFGRRILPLAGLSLRADGQAESGFLIPDIGYSASNGFELSGSYYKRLAENRDLLLSAYVFTQAAPMVSAQYRELTERGAYQVTAYATYGSRIPLGSATAQEESNFRGYIFANGKWQLDPQWSVTASVRLASDRTFLRRYDISRDDRLRSHVAVERIDDSSYFVMEGWATQLLLVPSAQGQVPLALPVIDYRRRMPGPLPGSRLELQANTLGIWRADGQDTQRAFARAKFDISRITPLGQEVTFTALARGDVYHTDDVFSTQTAAYRGEPGWQTRAVAIAAVDVRWPFLGEAFGGTQVITPRVQLVASPPIRNLAIPNEDARAIDLEDSNLFALNRFPGYDRVEDGVRLTYGFDWQINLPGLRIETTLGQSYRLTEEPTLFPDGTGLTDQFSDFVGRTNVRYRDFLSVTHSFRLDKDSLQVRRNEFNATIGSDSTYLTVGYLRLNRNIDRSFEDLQDREEVRFGGRVAFANYWSVFGSAVINLTDRDEDPSFTADGFEPLRTRLGIGYADDCLEFGISWRRDYISVADAEEGNSFRVYFSISNLGFR